MHLLHQIAAEMTDFDFNSPNLDKFVGHQKVLNSEC